MGLPKVEDADRELVAREVAAAGPQGDLFVELATRLYVEQPGIMDYMDDFIIEDTGLSRNAKTNALLAVLICYRMMEVAAERETRAEVANNN